MTTDIKQYAEKKRAIEINNEIVKDTMRDPAAVPFEVQIVAHVRRRFIEELIDAKHRGDDPARVSRMISITAVDMIMEFVMATVSPHQPELVVKMVDSTFKEMADMANAQISAYLQAPPQTPANKN